MSRPARGAAAACVIVMGAVGVVATSGGCGASSTSAPARLSGVPTSGSAASAGPSAAGGGATAVSLPDGCAPAGEPYRCNPVTNAGCNAAAGEACDDDEVGGFKCYPAPNPAKPGAACANDDDGPSCQPGFGCAGTTESNPEGTCARYCCTDAECAGKTCKPLDGASGTLGFCR